PPWPPDRAAAWPGTRGAGRGAASCERPPRPRCQPHEAERCTWRDRGQRCSLGSWTPPEVGSNPAFPEWSKGRGSPLNIWPTRALLLFLPHSNRLSAVSWVFEVFSLVELGIVRFRAPNLFPSFPRVIHEES